MRKSIINVFAMLLVAGFAFVSCSKESSEIESPSKGYKVSIPANKNFSKAVATDGTTTFKTTENVYIYNTNTGNIDATVLHPSVDAGSANFEGTLVGTYSEGNTLKVLYNTNSLGVADYSSQDGTLEGVIDAGVASVDVTSISGGTITTETATINNLQSIFKFTFKNGATTLNVKSVTITSGNNALQAQYDVVTNTPTFAPITVSLSTASSTVYAALRFTATANDPITFLITDENDNVYVANKNAPSSGFSIGKFYTSTINIYCFTVSDGKVVTFSPGNLVKTDDTYTVGSGNESYAFETVPFNTNSGSLGYGGDAPISTSARGYFTWSEIATETNTPRSFTVNGISGWRTLTQSEWDCLLRTRPIGTGMYRYYKVKNADGQAGLVLPPDNATTNDTNALGLEAGSKAKLVDINACISKGFVFLPGVGYYENSWNRAISDYWGYYWTCTMSATSGYGNHFFSNPNNTSFSITGNIRASDYLSVRLVHD